MKRLLLVSPTFHGYWRAIAAALQARGHEVSTHLYDEMPSVPRRIDHKLRVELPERLGLRQDWRADARMTQRAVQAVREFRPDAVVVVKGDTLSDDFYEAISTKPRVLWLYDELRRTRWADRDLAVAGTVCSYSMIDTASLEETGVPAHHLPLAFDDRLVPSPTTRRTEDVVFIGARYGEREKTLLTLDARGVPVRAYGRDWSRHAWDRARTWDLHRPNVPSDREIGRAEAYDVMTAALATLNIHGDQDGFTMRTFEACGVGGLQFIDRADVTELYDDGKEVASYASFDELEALCQRASVDDRWATGIRTAARARTLSDHTFNHRVAVLEQAWSV